MLNSAASIFSEIAIPTALAMPWPSGPVVVSMPRSKSNSGWPGVFDLSCLKFLRSSIDMSYPVRCSKLYKSMEPWPLDSTNLSLLNQCGLDGLWFKCFFHKAVAISAIPIGIPG